MLLYYHTIEPSIFGFWCLYACPTDLSGFYPGVLSGLNQVKKLWRHTSATSRSALFSVDVSFRYWFFCEENILMNLIKLTWILVKQIAFLLHKKIYIFLLKSQDVSSIKTRILAGMKRRVALDKGHPMSAPLGSSSAASGALCDSIRKKNRVITSGDLWSASTLPALMILMH